MADDSVTVERPAKDLRGLKPRRKGDPRLPGSGRKKGTPNRQSIAARELCSSLVHDVRYQFKLRDDFIRRKLHPTIESLIWAYSIGKPKESIELSGSIGVEQKLAVEAELIRTSLDYDALLALAAHSQALVDEAIAAAKGQRATLPAGTVTPQDVAVSVENYDVTDVTPEKTE